MSDKCGTKGCEKAAGRVGLKLHAFNGEIMKAMLDVYYCKSHSQHLSLDKLLGRDGWSFLVNHLNGLDLPAPQRENCEIYLVGPE